jgi:hypothetical protein
MIPQIKAKFRKKNGVPYAVERFAGVQYRCRACNQIFYHENILVRHLFAELRNGAFKVSRKCPKLDETISSLVYYDEDIIDAFKAVNVKRFKSGAVYDGMLKSKLTKR